MTSGIEIRMNRILHKGKMLCIPMDHGISNGPIEGLEDPHSMIYKCEHHGLTSVIINKGIMKTLPKPTKIGLLVHFSSSTSLSTAPNRKMLTGSVKEAIRAIITNKASEYTIGDRTFKYADLSELRRRESQLKAEVVRERKANMIANGLGDPHNLFVRF